MSARVLVGQLGIADVFAVPADTMPPGMVGVLTNDGASIQAEMPAPTWPEFDRAELMRQARAFVGLLIPGGTR
ncbi:hypothetical protein [Allonocardiopsis opalescens]|uniref:Uncharacterized protein n=1 Tax=Allonocardiopsis opalescens TaxID=1144618 RepID=A0A2T0PPM8_9ACTN|nr:hypothetical protein [Allonocardiopsis opalescens]PRX90852.1 hypothetical protein CLV72_11648 [Allonocardiopsis opalescens]